MDDCRRSQAPIYPHVRKVPAMTTPHDESATARLIRSRREMRRAYARDYGNETEAMIPCESITFAPRSDDDAQSAFMADEHKVEVQCAAERGFLWGAASTLVIVAVLTVALLAAYR